MLWLGYRMNWSFNSWLWVNRHMLSHHLLRWVFRIIRIIGIFAAFAVLSSSETVSEINLLLSFLLYYFSVLAALVRQFSMLASLIWIVSPRLATVVWVNANFVLLWWISTSESPPSMNMLLHWFLWVDDHFWWILHNSTLPFLPQNIYFPWHLLLDWFYLFIQTIISGVTTLVWYAQTIILLLNGSHWLLMTKSYSSTLTWSGRESATCLLQTLWLLGATGCTIHALLWSWVLWIVDIKPEFALLAWHCIL